jgi:hypothetical protein
VAASMMRSRDPTKVDSRITIPSMRARACCMGEPLVTVCTHCLMSEGFNVNPKKKFNENVAKAPRSRWIALSNPRHA